MRIIYNEISMEKEAETLEEGKILIKKFLKTYIKLRKYGINDSILSKHSLDEILLAQGYPIKKWRNDFNIDIELRRLYKRLNDKLEIIENRNECEVVCENNKKSIGVLEAYKIDGINISFSTSHLWMRNFISGTIYEISENEVIEENISIRNIFSEDSVDFHKEKIKSYLNKVKSGEELWNKRVELFQNLTFCKNVESQLNNLEKNNVGQVLKKLTMLNDYFNTWDKKIFDKDSIPQCTPESQETINKYREEHTFKTFDEREILFSWHIRFTGNIAGRIFFEPDRLTGKCIIGHIGEKLPTVTYGTH